ncbi:MAG: hypothetical protein K2K08_09545 [Paramuribaculum sp.]|nr:hypothetical protein [Paramuribaculum sp.]
MITDKEYPATHSMATAWYMVDSEGNVGLMAFDDNGPVPAFNSVEPDLYIPTLAFGEGFSADEKCEGIHLNLSQIHEICGEPKNPDDIEMWSRIALAIKNEYTSRFLLLCDNGDITNYGCISPEMNLFYVDAYDCIDSNKNNIIVGSTLDKMIKTGMIEAIYQIPEWEVNSEYDQITESVVFTKNFENAPYYIYCQPYWTSEPQHRMNTPSTPVKVEQIDEESRKRLLHVPVRFKDEEDIQIAQWFVCNSNDPELAVNNAGYSLFPIDKHTKRYCLTNPFLFDFFEYCPSKLNYGCSGCSRDCASTIRYIGSLEPTILYVVSPTRGFSVINQLEQLQDIQEKIAVFSYIPKFPYKKTKHWMSIDSVKNQMTKNVLIALLSSSRAWFENIVKTINPKVIIIENEALSVFASVFPVVHNEVIINNIGYSIFNKKSINENIELIKSLAKSPYQGEIFKMTYTKQEVEDLKRDGKVFKIGYE